MVTCQSGLGLSDRMSGSKRRDRSAAALCLFKTPQCFGNSAASFGEGLGGRKRGEGGGGGGWRGVISRPNRMSAGGRSLASRTSVVPVRGTYMEFRTVVKNQEFTLTLAVTPRDARCLCYYSRRFDDGTMSLTEAFVPEGFCGGSRVNKSSSLFSFA